MNCTVCGEQVAQERWDLGYHYCMKRECASVQPSKLENYRLILMPKQGFGFVTKDSPDLKEANKSSGR